MPLTWSPPPGWRISRRGWREGYLLRRAYAAALPQLPAPRVADRRPLDLDVVAFSSWPDLPEQVASLRSFLRHVGRPHRYLVVSDGSYDDRARRLVAGTDGCVEVMDWTEIAPPLPAYLAGYAATSPMGKKLAVELALPRDRPTLYVDSDVLFFPGAAELPAEVDRLVTAGRPAHLLDPEDAYLDPALLRDPAERRTPTNAGFLVLPRRLDWRPALDRLAAHPAPGFHAEQTVVHLALRAADAEALDPRRYVVATDDMAAYADRHRGDGLVLRHYTSPVRHKFWAAVARSWRPAQSASGSR